VLKRVFLNTKHALRIMSVRGNRRVKRAETVVQVEKLFLWKSPSIQHLYKVICEEAERPCLQLFILMMSSGDYELIVVLF